MLKSTKLCLLLALIFVFTLIIPAYGIPATGEVDFTSTYMYITTGTGQNAGIVTVKPNNADDTVHDTVYFDLSLPDGVKFTNIPGKADMTTGDDKLVQLINIDNYGFSFADRDFIKIWLAGNEFNKDHPDAVVKFDFSEIEFYENNKLDINKDFSGNLRVNVEVTGIASDRIVWSESDELTIAKVANTSLLVRQLEC